MKSDVKQKITGGAGLLALAALFIKQYADNPPSSAGLAAALISACLFAALCLRFIPIWFKSWEGETQAPPPETEKGELLKVFLFAIVWECTLFLLVTAARGVLTGDFSPGIWQSLDSRHYLDIAKDWYLTEGSLDRLVQLVFLPLYPILVRLAAYAAGDYLLAGILVSVLCFAFSACLLYKLLRLDFDSEKARFALAVMCVFPGAFFFVAPMSESLFLLLSLCCIYLSRRGKFLFACIFGALAGFTRSVGLALLVPVFFELTAQKRKLKNYACLLIIPLGFAAYCFINYSLTGDAFRFMQYQREHWSQSFGLFFNTAAYQTAYAIDAAKHNTQSFFGLWLPNLLAQLLSLGIMCAGVKKLRASYSAYFISYFFVTVGVTWLLSAPRYMLVMFPMYAALAELCDTRYKKVLCLVLCALLGLAYIALFALRWQVW